MTLPETDRFRQPTLQALSGGAPATNGQVADRVQELLEVSDEDRAQLPPASPVPTFTNRVAWAFVDLQKRGLVDKTRTKPNTYKITQAGERALAAGLDLSAVSPRGTPPTNRRQAARSDSRPHALPLAARAFNPDRPPKQGEFQEADLDQEAKHQLLEKAKQGHHRILVDLVRWLAARRWTAIEEIPGSIDLWATSPSGRRWIFEAKTIRDANQLSQTRGALAQLLEYRLEYGGDEDAVCIALDVSLHPERSALLGRLGVAVVRVTDVSVDSLNAPAEEMRE